MPRPPLVLILLAACLGCDAGKLNELARQAAGSVVEEAVVTTDDAPDSEPLIGDFFDSMQRLADTLSAMQDERSARANLGRLKRVLQRLREQGEVLQDAIRENPAVVETQTAGDEQRLEKTSFQLLAEFSRIARSPEIDKIVEQAYSELRIDRSPWQFGGSTSPQAQAAVAAPGSIPFPSSPPPIGIRDRPFDFAPIPVPPRIQELRDSFEREKQRAGVGIPVVARPEPLAGPGILTIIIENMPADGHHALVRRCTEITSPSGYQSHSSGRRFEFRIEHAEDVKAVSKKITFATITAIDQSSRTITAKY